MSKVSNEKLTGASCGVEKGKLKVDKGLGEWSRSEKEVISFGFSRSNASSLHYSIRIWGG